MSGFVVDFSTLPVIKGQSWRPCYHWAFQCPTGASMVGSCVAEMLPKVVAPWNSRRGALVFTIHLLDFLCRKLNPQLILLGKSIWKIMCSFSFEMDDNHRFCGACIACVAIDRNDAHPIPCYEHGIGCWLISWHMSNGNKQCECVGYAPSLS